jgi:hypothetical protein
MPLLHTHQRRKQLGVVASCDISQWEARSCRAPATEHKLCACSYMIIHTYYVTVTPPSTPPHNNNIIIINIIITISNNAVYLPSRQRPLARARRRVGRSELPRRRWERAEWLLPSTPRPHSHLPFHPARLPRLQPIVSMISIIVLRGGRQTARSPARYIIIIVIIIIIIIIVIVIIIIIIIIIIIPWRARPPAPPSCGTRRAARAAQTAPGRGPHARKAGLSVS